MEGVLVIKNVSAQLLQLHSTEGVLVITNVVCQNLQLL